MLTGFEYRAMFPTMGTVEYKYISIWIHSCGWIAYTGAVSETTGRVGVWIDRSIGDFWF